MSRPSINNKRVHGSILDILAFSIRLVYTSVSSNSGPGPIRCGSSNVLQRDMNVIGLNCLGSFAIVLYIVLAALWVGTSVCERKIFCTPPLTVVLRSIVHTLLFSSTTNLSFLNCINQDGQIDFANGTLHRVGPLGVGPLGGNTTQQLTKCDLRDIPPFDHIFAGSSCFSTEESILISLFLLACSLFTLLEWRCKPSPADTMDQPLLSGVEGNAEIADAHAGSAAQEEMADANAGPAALPALFQHPSAADPQQAAGDAATAVLPPAAGA